MPGSRSVLGPGAGRPPASPSASAWSETFAENSEFAAPPACCSANRLGTAPISPSGVAQFHHASVASGTRSRIARSNEYRNARCQQEEGAAVLALEGQRQAVQPREARVAALVDVAQAIMPA